MHFAISEEAAKFSDLAVMRYVFAPLMLAVGFMAITNYKNVVERQFMQKFGRTPGKSVVVSVRVVGTVWAGVGITLILGLW